MGPGEVVPKATYGGSLRRTLQERLRTVKDIPPMTADSWLRASALADLCPREEVLAARLKLARTDTVEPDLAVIFAHGHGLHWAAQNQLLAGIKVLVGQWKCLGCAKLYGGYDPTGRAPLSDQYVYRPVGCSTCGAEASFVYVEQHFKNDEYRITGHPDGFLVLPGMPGLGVLEVKSVGGKSAWEIKSMPMLSHVVQAHIYMWFTGFRWAKILYWEKGGIGINALTEHQVERDEQTIENIKRMIVTMREGIRSGVLPPRICQAATDKLAGECPAKIPCFQTGDPPREDGAPF